MCVILTGHKRFSLIYTTYFTLQDPSSPSGPDLSSRPDVNEEYWKWEKGVIELRRQYCSHRPDEFAAYFIWFNRVSLEYFVPSSVWNQKMFLGQYGSNDVMWCWSLINVFVGMFGRWEWSFNYLKYVLCNNSLNKCETISILFYSATVPLTTRIGRDLSLLS